MKPAEFEYVAPATVEEALSYLGEHGDESKLLAGGQSLVPMMNFRLARPERLVDLNGIAGLSYIEHRDSHLAIGAMTRHRALEHSDLLAAGWPLITEAVGWIGHQQIRNRGTIGGSVAHADPAAELPVTLTALDARFRVRSHRGERTLACADFFASSFMTTLEPDEMLVEVEVPALPERSGSSFMEFARRHGDFGLGGAAVVLTTDGSGACSQARIALLAAAPVPVRAGAAEDLLVGSSLDDATLSAAADAAVEGLSPSGDIHGGTAYRLRLLRTMTHRALTTAARRSLGE
ncbi:MAG TPA: xanthine dehydrogenase family protein subunit M [Acidimicrobiales bacterium]|nr:xanthine dehydrogenase family protein subunit M [Acidimicrobiales bacterium]